MKPKRQRYEKRSAIEMVIALPDDHVSPVCVCLGGGQAYRICWTGGHGRSIYISTFVCDIFPCRIRESFHITAWTQVDHVLPACLFRYYFFSLSRGTCFFAESQFCKSLHDWPCRARAGGVGVHRKTPRLPGQPWLPIPDPFPLSPHRPVFLNNLELQFAK